MDKLPRTAGGKRMEEVEGLPEISHEEFSKPGSLRNLISVTVDSIWMIVKTLASLA